MFKICVTSSEGEVSNGRTTLRHPLNDPVNPGQPRAFTRDEALYWLDRLTKLDPENAVSYHRIDQEAT